MKRFTILFVLLVMCCGCSSAGADEPVLMQNSSIARTQATSTDQDAGGTDLTTAMTAAADAVLAAVNVRRALAGIPPLIQQAALLEVAYERSVDMAVRGYLAHVDPETGRQVAEDLLRAADFRGQVAELLFQSETPIGELSQSAVAAWFQDPDHNLILLSPDFRFVGIGMMGDGQRWIVTMILAGESP
jgi:uncharacterized protein YkwD